MNYTREDRKRDFDFFVTHNEELFKKYGHSFLAIKNGHILGAYRSFGQATEKTDEEEGTYIVQECTGDESGYMTFISPMVFLQEK